MNLAHDTMRRNVSSLIRHLVLKCVLHLLRLPPVCRSAQRAGWKSGRNILEAMKAMDTEDRALRALAQTYFDAAYEMDADKFASVFHPSSSVTKIGDDGNVSVTPIAVWLSAVRNMTAPKQQGLERDDRIVSIDVERELALLKLTLQIPPRHFTDMLSCLKDNGTWKIVQKVMTSKT